MIDKIDNITERLNIIRSGYFYPGGYGVPFSKREIQGILEDLEKPGELRVSTGLFIFSLKGKNLIIEPDFKFKIKRSSHKKQ